MAVDSIIKVGVSGDDELTTRSLLEDMMMKRIAFCVAVLTGIGIGMAYGEEASPVKPQAESRAVTQAKPQVTRTYRRYSVAPSNRAAMRPSRHASHATWRHADSKAAGQFHSGR